MTNQKNNPPLLVTLKDGRAVTLRLLQASDGELLAGLYTAVPISDQRFYCPHPLDRAHALQNAARADDPCRIVLVAETSQGEFAGYAWVRWKEIDSECGGFGICIRPDWQGNGTGGALMRRLFDIVRAYGPPQVSLTVQKANERGVSLYQKLGFKITEERERAPLAWLNIPAEPEYVMTMFCR